MRFNFIEFQCLRFLAYRLLGATIAKKALILAMHCRNIMGNLSRYEKSCDF